MCMVGYKFYGFTYEGCEEKSLIEEQDCKETCSTLDIWVAGSNGTQRKKPITVMQCGKEGSFSKFEDADSTCNPFCSKEELEEIKIFHCLSVFNSRACCETMSNIQVASRTYCNNAKYNNHCKDRYVIDQKCTEKM